MYARKGSGVLRFVTTYLMGFLFLTQLLFLSDHISLVQDYFCNVELNWPIEYNSNGFYLLPSLFFIILALLDHFINSTSQSLLKRGYYNLYFALFVIQIVELLVLKFDFEAQILFMYFPIGLFLGRFLVFIKNPYLQNLTAALSIIALLAIKLFNFSLF